MARKNVAPNPLAKKAETAKSTGNPLFEKRVRNFGIGGNILPKRNLSRYVKWPKYIRFQRQRTVLLQRLKVPPQIAQFSATAEKNLANEVFALLDKYRPEDKAQKKQRLVAAAEAKAAGKEAENVAPVTVKYGLNHVTALIEAKKAKLVVIAHDVDPLELVVFLPALCKKMEVPYVIVKGRARLGTVVHQKTAAVAAIVDVRAEDRAQLTKVTESAVANFNDKYDVRRRTWGGQVMGIKSQTKTAQINAKIAKDALAHSKF